MPKPARAAGIGRPEMAEKGVKAWTFFGKGGEGGRPRFQEGFRTWPLATLLATVVTAFSVARARTREDVATAG